MKISLDKSLINPSISNIPNTYEFKTDDNKNVLTVHLPSYNPSKEMSLSISYSVKNAFRKNNNNLLYYNTFFSDRTDSTFNTNVKGNISFHYPENAIRTFGANSKDFWVNEGKQKFISNRLQKQTSL
ncbi:MAG: hypothetical protein GX219_04135 [Tissierellia bacterium]|nr:hypothetical protein [Tissierellia bacterium]